MRKGKNAWINPDDGNPGYENVYAETGCTIEYYACVSRLISLHTCLARPGKVVHRGINGQQTGGLPGRLPYSPVLKAILFFHQETSQFQGYMV